MRERHLDHVKRNANGNSLELKVDRDSEVCPVVWGCPTVGGKAESSIECLEGDSRSSIEDLDFSSNMSNNK